MVRQILRYLKKKNCAHTHTHIYFEAKRWSWLSPNEAQNLSRANEGIFEMTE